MLHLKKFPQSDQEKQERSKYKIRKNSRKIKACSKKKTDNNPLKILINGHHWKPDKFWKIKKSPITYCK